MNRRALFIIISILILISGGIYWGFFTRHTTSSETIGHITLSRGNIEETVTAQGTLQPKEYVDVGAQVSGQLKKLHVDLGYIVKKGDLIAEIDPQVYDSRVKASKAKLDTLKAQLAEQEAEDTLARQQLERNQRLINAKAISQEALEDSQTAKKVAEARVASLKAQIDEAQSTLEGDQANLQYTKIYAPMDGTVVVLTTREGQTVNANQTAPVIVQLANLDIMTVKAQVAEADVMRLKPGMSVSFATLGSLDRRWTGTIRQILPSPEIINDVVLYNALVDVDNADRQLMSGMSTQMFFELGKAENVLLLPTAALGKALPEENNDKGTAYQIRTPTGVKTIHTGLMSRNSVEVREGLSEGDTVIAPRDTAKGAAGQTPRGFGPRI